VSADLRLRDLKRGELPSFRRFTRPMRARGWRFVHWAECPDCGTSPMAPCEVEGGGTYDGEPLVCIDCGEVGHVSVSEGEAHEQWAETEEGEKLRPSALAGLRRILGVRPPHDAW